VDEMVERSVDLLTNSSRHRVMAQAAADVVRTRYCTELIVPLYEAAYGAVLTDRAR
jgi:hypothetical protein